MRSIHRRPAWARFVAALAILAVLTPACAFHDLGVASMVPEEGVPVESAVKAHLDDGGVVLFRSGFVLRGGTLYGAGEVYDALLEPRGATAELPLARVVAFESYRADLDAAKSVGVSLLAAGAGLAAGVVLAVAIFGSCPTVYSLEGDRPRLEAETFSYSIAPLFEARDLDSLSGARADERGRVTLEVRNEALETHYINQLALVEVVHAPGDRALPDQEGRVAVVRGLRPVRSALDRSGRAVTDRIAEADGDDYRTPRAVVLRASTSTAKEDLVDWLELELDVPPGDGRPALVIAARNSLLITVLFYDVMLGRAGARALDWLGRDLSRISTTVELGRWLHERSGLRVELWRDGAWQGVGRLPDPGPISLRRAVLDLPELPPGPAKLRLSFLADSWRIDQLSIGRRADGETRLIEPSVLRDAEDRPRPEIRARIAAPDESYLVTYPGQRLRLSFDVGPAPPRRARSFLIASQGYYVEWVRGDWVRRAGGGAPFEPTDAALRAALERWRQRQPELERDFSRLRVPTR